VVPLFGGDPSRWSFIACMATTGQSAWIGLDTNLASNHGILLGNASPYFSANFRDHGGLINSPWFAFIPVGTNVYLIEVFYRPIGVEVVTPEMMEEIAEVLQGGEVLQVEQPSMTRWARRPAERRD